MHLSRIINLNTVCIDSSSQSKTAVLLKISQLLSQANPQLEVDHLFDAYWKRESLGSTAIGQGITIPHVRAAGITKPQACVLRLLNPVDFGAEDKQPVDLVIGFVVPQENVEQHLQILASIIKQFKTPAFREACRRSTTSEDFYHLLTADALEEATA